MKDDSLLVFNKNLDQLSLDDISEFVQSHPNESLYYDYKDFDILSGDKISKAISAFANSSGGNIIIGVKASGDGNNNEPKLQLTSNLQYTKDHVTQKITDSVHPYVHGIRVIQIFNDDRSGWVLVIHVPPSDNPPHMASDYKYYHRVEATSKPMEHYHVERAFNSIKYPIIEPKASIERKGDIVTLQMSIRNSSSKICKLPYLKVQFYHCKLIPDNSASVLHTPNGFQFSPRDTVIYGHSSLDIGDFSVISSEPFFILFAIAGENFDSKLFCAYVDYNPPNSNFVTKIDLSTDMGVFWSQYGIHLSDEMKIQFIDICAESIEQEYPNVDDTVKEKIRNQVISLLNDNKRSN